MKPTSKNKILFSELQRMNQWYIVLILTIINFAVLYSLYTGRESTTGIVVSIIIVGLVDVLILSYHQKTVITQEGMLVKIFPFHRKFKSVVWEDVEALKVIQYKPIREFGGWGIRHSLKKNTKVYSTAGKSGLLITFPKNKQLLIGTQNAEELEKVVPKIKLG